MTSRKPVNVIFCSSAVRAISGPQLGQQLNDLQNESSEQNGSLFTTESASVTVTPFGRRHTTERAGLKVTRRSRTGGPRSSRPAGQDGLRTRTARGGSVSASEYGCPCHGLSSAHTPPSFPRLLPPYSPASLLISSR